MHPAAILKARGLRASKKRGQNFLIHPATAKAIALSSGATGGDFVVEIGPGLGALTLALADLADKVLAVEVDRGLCEVLPGIIKDQGAQNIELLPGDALELDWREIGGRWPGPFILAGNLPYAISSPLLFSLLDAWGAWKSATVMVQRELAQRLCCEPGSKNYGRITVLVKTWCEVKPDMVIGPDQFFPRPNVDSQVLHILPRKHPLVDLAGPDERAWFSKVVKAAFSQRRKTLNNSLAGGLGEDKAIIKAALEKAGLNPSRRAETLTPREFGAAANAIRSSLS